MYCRPVPAFLAALGICLLSSTPSRAEDPTIAQLVEGAPVITATDAEITAFSFDLEWNSRCATCVWHREGDIGLLVKSNEDETPFFFISNGRAACFDVCTGAIYLLENMGPEVTLDVEDGMRFGLASAENTDITIDVTPLLNLFLDLDESERAMFRDEDGQWVLGTASDGEGWTLLAFFDGDAPCQLRELEYVFHEESHEPSIHLKNLRLNEEVTVEWPEPLTVENAPADLPVVTGIELGQPFNEESRAKVVGLSRAMIGHEALMHPEFRSESILAEVDWDEAAEHAERFREIDFGLQE